MYVLIKYYTHIHTHAKVGNEHFHKCIKPDPKVSHKGQILYDSMYRQCLEQSDFIKTEIVVARGWGGGRNWELFKGYRVPVWEDEKV